MWKVNRQYHPKKRHKDTKLTRNVCKIFIKSHKYTKYYIFFLHKKLFYRELFLFHKNFMYFCKIELVSYCKIVV